MSAGMHINLESDYAVRIVQCLAREKERLDAQTISERTAVSLRFSLKEYCWNRAVLWNKAEPIL